MSNSMNILLMGLLGAVEVQRMTLIWEKGGYLSNGNLWDVSEGRGL